MKRSAVFWAIVLIGLGVLLILRENVSSWRNVSIGSLVLIAVGAWLLLERPWFGWVGGAPIVATILLGIGVVLLLQDLDVIPESFTLWPIILIAIGAAILIGSVGTNRPVASSEQAVPLDGATSATVTCSHGAGRLLVVPSTQPDLLLNGTFAGGVEARVNRVGTAIDVDLRQRWKGVPWQSGSRGFEWAVSLTPAVPLSLRFHVGASQTRLELADLQVADLLLQTGASQTELTLPKRGRCTARVRAGAAQVRIRIPEGVAARIRMRKAIGGSGVDTSRFPLVGEAYESPDFDQAEDRVDLDIEGGAANVTVD
jgi:LiaI-LiaF-like transmembrane region